MLPWSNIKNSPHEKISIPPLQDNLKPSRKNLNLLEKFLPPSPSRENCLTIAETTLNNRTKSQPLPKNPNPSWKISTSQKMSQSPWNFSIPLKSFSTPRKFFNAIEKISTPPKKNLNVVPSQNKFNLSWIISRPPEKISTPPEKISTPSEKISTPPEKSQPPLKFLNPLENFSTPPPKISQPPHPLPKISQPHSKKNHSQKIFPKWSWINAPTPTP